MYRPSAVVEPQPQQQQEQQQQQQQQQQVPAVSTAPRAAAGGDTFAAQAEECADHFNRLACGLLAVSQFAILDFFLVSGLGTPWLLFLLADAAVLAVLVFGFVTTYLYNRGEHTRLLTQRQRGRLPFAYGAWLLHQATVTLRLCVIYYSLASAVASWGLVGPNLLRLAGGLSCGVAVFLPKALVLGPAYSPRNGVFLARLAAEAVADILDAVDILDVLLASGTRSLLPSGLAETILAVAAAATLLPGSAFAAFAFADFGDCGRGTGRLLRSLHLLLSAACNLPLLVIRLVLWFSLSANVASAFVVKNLLFLFLNGGELFRQSVPELSGQVQRKQQQQQQQQQQQPLVSAASA